jgi:hypothetical protein
VVGWQLPFEPVAMADTLPVFELHERVVHVSDPDAEGKLTSRRGQLLYVEWDASDAE